MKLFGTPWQPDFTGRILFLESLSGSLLRIESMLRQYQQIGAFSSCSGILLGNFTELAKAGLLEELYTVVQEMAINKSLPIACTTELGHQTDSRCLRYGQQYLFHA
jgi:muramoyltetrapeptide carboxypeptidase LdcA involved in peptidoglycan recycling